MSRSRWLPKRGQSLVEYALIAPLLFAMMFILIELGIVFSIYVGLTNSAREAARAAVGYQYPDSTATICPALTPPAPPTPPPTPDMDTVDCQRQEIMDRAIINTGNPLFSIANTSDVDKLGPAVIPAPKCPSGSPSPYRYCYPEDPPSDAYRYGDSVVVTLAYEHELFFNLLGPSKITIRATSQMRLEPGG